MIDNSDWRPFAAGTLLALALDRVASAYWLEPRLVVSPPLTIGIILFVGCAVLLARYAMHRRRR
jgi:hypothetical protein